MITYAQNFEDVLLERCFGNISKGFYIDVGAGLPVKDNVTYHFYLKGWRGINVEPQYSLWKQLEALRPEDCNLNCGVGDHTGTFDLFQIKERWEFATFDKDIAHEHESSGFHVEKKKVQIDKLDNILRDRNVEEIHFLKVDVEGYEDNVIRSIDLNRYRPKVIIIEANHPATTERSCHDWNDLLPRSGYLFAFYDGLNSYYVEANSGLDSSLINTPVSIFDDVKITVSHHFARDLVDESYSGLFGKVVSLGLSESNFRNRKIMSDESAQNNRDLELAKILDDYSVNEGYFPMEVVDLWKEVKLGKYESIVEILSFPVRYAPEEAPAIVLEDELYHRFYDSEELKEEYCCLGKLRLLRLFFSHLNEKERSECINVFNAKRPNYRALLIYLSEIDLVSGNYSEASEKLTHALGSYFDDVYAQRLFLHATGSPIPTLGLSERFCDMPFKDFEVNQGGEVYLCCKPFLPISAGNVFHERWQDIWNSKSAQLIRKSILDGSFKYCSPISCPYVHYLPHRNYVREHSVFARNLEKKVQTVEQAPTRAALSYDRSCNIKCAQCRKRLITAKGEWRSTLNTLKDEFTLPFLKEIRRGYITGSGDAFGSEHFYKVLKELNRDDFPNLSLHLSTNGQLLTPRTWENLNNLKGMIDILTVSIDGATKRTYEELRCGGSYDLLMNNMVYISKKRKAGEIERLDVNMVVQSENFKEMKPLILMCEKWGVDQVLFYRLRQWGTYSQEEYTERNIFSPLHPMHKQLLEELKDDVFCSSIVLPWDLKPFLPRKSSENNIKKRHDEFFEKR